MNHEIVLSGCTPIPLAHYLKAIGILRLVGEQIDPAVRGGWRNGTFFLRSKLTREELVDFFLKTYRPSAIVVPWSGSDFFGIKQEIASDQSPLVHRSRPTSSGIIEAILATSSERLSDYRDTIRKTLAAIKECGVQKKKDIEGNGPAQRRNKSRMLQTLRNRLSDDVLAWIDSACVIEPDGLTFNTLLGSGGGSDGNSHFSDNFMQALWLSLNDFDEQRSTSTRASNGLEFDSRSAIVDSLFGEPFQNTYIADLSPVLFDSTRVGGPNLTSGFIAGSSSNPWNFILMLEGSFLFAGSLGKKLGNVRPTVASFPFLLNATLAGYGSLSKSESQGRELWLPLWDTPSSCGEIAQLFANGRIEKHGRTAMNGLDAFAAIAQLGIDGGVKKFQRVGFFRGRIGGDNYFTAIDQGVHECQRNKHVDLLKDIDTWLDRFRTRAKADDAPASAVRALQELENRILDLCQDSKPEGVQGVLIALGRCEAAMARSPKWTQPPPPAGSLRPVPLLRPEWLVAAGGHSKPEFRLAAALASVGGKYGREWLSLRCHLEPVEPGGGPEQPFFLWAKNSGNDVVWHEGDPVAAMNAVFARRLVRAAQAGTDRNLPDVSRVPVTFDDVSAFIAGETDDELLASLLRGLSLLDWSKVRPEHRPPLPAKDSAAAPSALYALLKLCFQRPPPDEKALPLVPGIHHRAASEDGLEASRLAVRRLRASGFPPAVDEVPVQGEQVRRTAAALLFPLTPWQVGRLRLAVLRPDQEPDFTSLELATADLTHHLA